MDIAAGKLKRKSQVPRRPEKSFQKVLQGQPCSPLNAITRTRWAAPGCRLRQRREERGRERALWISGGVSQKIARRDLQQVGLKAGGCKASAPLIWRSLLGLFRVVPGRQGLCIRSQPASQSPTLDYPIAVPQ